MNEPFGQNIKSHKDNSFFLKPFAIRKFKIHGWKREIPKPITINNVKWTKCTAQTLNIIKYHKVKH